MRENSNYCFFISVSLSEVREQIPVWTIDSNVEHRKHGMNEDQEMAFHSALMLHFKRLVLQTAVAT